MTWAMAASLILQYGLPFVEGLVQRIESNAQVTAQDFAALKGTIQQNTPENLLAQAAGLAGISPTDPRYQQVLALITPQAVPPLKVS